MQKAKVGRRPRPADSFDKTHNRKIHSQLTPKRVSSGHFCVLPCSHKCRKVCCLRERTVAHNPKVGGSNPPYATKASVPPAT